MLKKKNGSGNPRNHVDFRCLLESAMHCVSLLLPRNKGRWTNLPVLLTSEEGRSHIVIPAYRFLCFTSKNLLWKMVIFVYIDTCILVFHSYKQFIVYDGKFYAIVILLDFWQIKMGISLNWHGYFFRTFFSYLADCISYVLVLREFLKELVWPKKSKFLAYICIWNEWDIWISKLNRASVKRTYHIYYALRLPPDGQIKLQRRTADFQNFFCPPEIDTRSVQMKTPQYFRELPSEIL